MSVIVRPLTNSPSRETLDTEFPSQFAMWKNRSLRLDAGGTHFGYIQSGQITLTWKHGSFQLTQGMYFSVPGEAEVLADECPTLSQGFVATRMGYSGFFHVGGPVEEHGRLSYIDGCSDSLLVSPVVEGDPCLNLLHLPPHTVQTEHVHPSCRLGVVASGHGICRTPDSDIPLGPGDSFEIAPQALHSFHTDTEPLRVIAWHPDSDFGPTHHDHPMINRTIIAGTSAAERARQISGSDSLNQRKWQER